MGAASNMSIMLMSEIEGQRGNSNCLLSCSCTDRPQATTAPFLLEPSMHHERSIHRPSLTRREEPTLGRER